MKTVIYLSIVISLAQTGFAHSFEGTFYSDKLHPDLRNRMIIWCNAFEVNECVEQMAAKYHTRRLDRYENLECALQSDGDVNAANKCLLVEAQTALIEAQEAHARLIGDQVQPSKEGVSTIGRWVLGFVAVLLLSILVPCVSLVRNSQRKARED